MGLIAIAMLCLHSITLGVALSARRPGSRRVLAVAFACMIPGFGIPLAFLALRIRGSGEFVEPSDDFEVSESAVEERPSAPNSMLDRLLSGERPEALAALAYIGDAGAISLLRWTVENGDEADAVLDAALTLEELSNGYEEEFAVACAAASEEPSFGNAMIAANAAAGAILSGLADASEVEPLLDRARAFYRQAIELAPDRWSCVVERWCELEINTTHPLTALELLSKPPASLSIESLDRESRRRLNELKADAAFAARRFDLHFEVVDAA
jgi:tetratricopeptide (TPR) repeat protein